MKRMVSPLDNEDGAMLIVAVLVLALLTIIGISATTTSTIEVQIAGNERVHETAFYKAESGWQVGINWLNSKPSGVTADCGSNNGAGELFVVSKADNPDTLNGGYAVDIDFTGAEHVPGYSTDFRRYSYSVTSTGAGPANAQSQVQVTAGKIFKVGGY